MADEGKRVERGPGTAAAAAERRQGKRRGEGKGSPTESGAFAKRDAAVCDACA